MKRQNEMRDLIKSQLLDAPFKTAFKATLGFYTAQALVSFLALLVFLVGLGIFGLGIYWLAQ